jgi:hypothetical protein
VPFGEPRRSFIIEVKKGGCWMTPGSAFSGPYREATSKAMAYALRTSSQGFRIKEHGRPIAEANTVRTFEWIRGNRDFGEP